MNAHDGGHGDVGCGNNDIPINIIHIILSYLPDAKERAQKALISRSWLFAWNTHPYLTFNQADIVPTLNLNNSYDVLQKTLDTYISLVDGAISKYEQLSNNATVKQFRLQLKLFDSKLKDCMDRWIQIALCRRLEDLTLAIDNTDYRLYDDDGKALYYTVPKEVFSNGFIQTLKLLGGPRIWLPFSSSCDVDINLSGLRSLSLDVTMNEEMLEKLVAGCPLLEKLMIHLDTYTRRYNVSRLSRLKMVQVTRVNHGGEGYDVFIGVPKTLDTFVLVNFGYLPSFFDKGINLEQEQHDRYFILWSPSQRHTCADTRDTILRPPQLQLIVKNSPQQCGVDIESCVQDVLCSHWLGPLRLLLDRSRSSSTIKIKVISVSVFNTGGVVGRFFSCGGLSSSSGPACDVEQLNLDVEEMPSWCYSEVLNSVLAILHPEKLYISPNVKASFLESLYKEIDRKDACCICFLKCMSPCWHHYLDYANMVRPEGLEEFGAVCRTRLSSMLPSFNNHQRPVCFRLRWRSWPRTILSSHVIMIDLCSGD